MSEWQRETETQIYRDREKSRERQRQRQRETERDRETETERDGERQRDRDRERGEIKEQIDGVEREYFFSHDFADFIHSPPLINLLQESVEERPKA